MVGFIVFVTDMMDVNLIITADCYYVPCVKFQFIFKTLKRSLTKTSTILST